jgi:hypothetical protein
MSFFSWNDGKVQSVKCLIITIFLALLIGCSGGPKHYALIEQSLIAGNPRQAVTILETAQPWYGEKSQVLYGMDRGMVLNLAGDYQASNEILERTEQQVEDLYTKSARTESAAFLTNDTMIPFEGAPFEQVMINVVKTLNYAAMGNLADTLVEARRLDHRLNVLMDRNTGKPDAYVDDAFARYLTGIMFESAGELNDALIAYRKAYEAYQKSASWFKTPIPTQLKEDLLRVSEAVQFTDELAQYRQAFPDVTWKSRAELGPLAQVIVISHNGRAPRKEDHFLDLPISREAFNLVQSKKAGVFDRPEMQSDRAADSIWYGLNGRVVRVALPKLVPQKTTVGSETVRLIGPEGTVERKTVLACNITALAEKQLSEELTAVSVKAVARSVVKFTLAEAAAQGAKAAAGKDAGPLVGILVGTMAKGIAIASEEADKRSWRTLPDEIHIARLWVPAGTYGYVVEPMGQTPQPASAQSSRMLTLRPAETHVLIERIVP